MVLHAQSHGKHPHYPILSVTLPHTLAIVNYIYSLLVNGVASKCQREQQWVKQSLLPYPLTTEVMAVLYIVSE